MILDTSFVIDLMDNEENAAKKYHELLRRGEPQKLTVVTLFEIYSGIIQCTMPEEEKNKVQKIVAGQILLHLDPNAAKMAGKIDGESSIKGQKIEPTDSMIAGIALIKKDTLLTRNVKHFSRIPELEIETY